MNLKKLPTELELEPFKKYLDLLLKWNKKINLTAIREPARIWEEHFLDSLMAVPYLKTVSSLLDIGSGAGFPGVPIKIALPSLQVTLCEAIKKKADFVCEVIRKLDLKGIEIVQRHLKPGTKIGMFDVIVSRGTMSLAKLFEYQNLLTPNGFLLVFKGVNIEEEIKELKAMFGEIDLTIYPYTLPQSLKRHSLIKISSWGREPLK